VHAGGRIANVRVHGAKALPDLQRQWIRNINIDVGPVDHDRSGMLLKPGERQKLPERLARTGSSSMTWRLHMTRPGTPHGHSRSTCS
jgi:hypothetical protein